MTDMQQEYKYYTNSNLEEINSAESYKELFNVALKVLKSMPKPIVQVCGPISSGGLESIEKNLEVLSKTIQKLEKDGFHIFGQVPFEKSMERLKHKYSSKKDADEALLNEFYLPIFEAGYIETCFFISGWESSFGARWEREQSKRLNIKIIDLPKDFLLTD